MRNPIMTVAFAACVAVPLSVSAEGTSPATAQSSTEKTGFSQLSGVVPEIWHQLHLKGSGPTVQGRAGNLHI